MPSDPEKSVFLPAKNYTGVVMQQVQVQLDSDSNEQSASQVTRLSLRSLRWLSISFL
jgi:hypothetical protein